uniref:Uncharacterized protein n=1 Tax=Rhizophora mucronata TaxID=61149 RepID=A0A2P2N603_RHIMU
MDSRTLQHYAKGH